MDARKPLAELRGSLPFHSVYLVTPIAAIAWLIAIAGVGAVANQCNDNNSSSYCGAALGLEWASLALEPVLLILIVISVPTQVFRNFRYMLSIWLSIPTVLMMTSAHSAILTLKALNEAANQAEDALQSAGINVDLKVKTSFKNAVRCAAAGLIILAIVNWLLIAYITVDMLPDNDLPVQQSPPQTMAYAPQYPVQYTQPMAVSVEAPPAEPVIKTVEVPLADTRQQH